MITFSYQARDPAGRIVSGIQDALNEDNAITSLMGRGLMVLSLQKKSVASLTRKRTWSVKETDLVLFTRQLATMIEAGISLVQALTALYEQCDPKRQRNLRYIISDVTAGARRRNFPRRNREASAGIQPAICQHGEGWRGRRFAG
jgi:type II secretory pathway component PulF